jgi:hypothetical protein
MKMSLRWPYDPGAEIITEQPAKRATRGSGEALGFAARMRRQAPVQRAVLDSDEPVVSVRWRPAVRPLFYDCFEKRTEALYRQLADCPETPEGVLDFVRKFGLLHNLTREPVDRICHEIKVMRSAVDAADRRDWPALGSWLDQSENRRALGVEATFAHEPDDPRPSLFFRPRDLISAMYLQLLQDATTSAQLKKCARPGCGRWFKYGAGTKRRSTAEYCEPACQAAHAHVRRHGGQR